MDWLIIRGWRSVLIGLLPIVLVLGACTATSDDGSHQMEAVAPHGEAAAGDPAAVVNLEKLRAVSSDQPLEYQTINMRITDAGYQPAAISIPLGQRVKLVVRNHGRTEHHYRIMGLVPGDLRWRVPAEMSEEEMTSEEDNHDLHHAGAFVSMRSASPAGIQPTGKEVHAYAQGGGLDVVLFIPTNQGIFEVQDPLHPEIVGQVTVFMPETAQAQTFEHVRLRTQELLRTTALTKYHGNADINLEVLYTPPAYFAMAVDEEAAARYAPDKFYVFLVSETMHEGESLPDSLPPATLRVDGQEIDLFDVNSLIGSSHHRTSILRFAYSKAEAPQAMELLIADADPLRWNPADISYTVSTESAGWSVFGLSWALLLPGLGGMLAALGPCLTQLVVYYIATLTGVGMEVLEDQSARSTHRGRILRTAIFFSLGFTVVYTAGGAVAGVIGQSLQSLGLLETFNRPLSVISGLAILVMAWRVIVNARAPLVCNLPLASKTRSASGTGLWGAMMTGIAFAFGCLSCFGATVLTVLLLYIGASGSVFQGAFIMFVFSLGLTVPFLLGALAIDRLVPFLRRAERVAPWLGLASGVVMIGFGLLMITYRFHVVSSLIYGWLFI